MLSYRHGFHAGNAADVLKHSLLTVAVSALKQKDKPFVYIDTHAGAGSYNLRSTYAEKTAEFRDGIGRLWPVIDQKAPPVASEYLRILRDLNKSRTLQFYPGSPQLVRYMLRPEDRMQLSELHKSDYGLLRELFGRDRKVQVYAEDGLENLKAKLPPLERRGLIFIDPSYEIKNEYYRVVSAIQDACQRFNTGVYCVWYPVIERRATEKYLQRFAASGIRRQLRIEHCLQDDAPGLGMTGSGLLWINPPWQLDAQANVLLPWLNEALTGNQGHWRVEWLVGE